MAKPKAAGEFLKPAPTTDYEVISPLSHDLEDYAIGDTVALTDDQAKPLLGRAVKAIEPAAS